MATSAWSVRRPRGQARAVVGQGWFPWLLVGPMIVGLLGFAVYPLIYILLLSASQSQLGNTFQRWVGFGNYERALTGGAFPAALWRSMVFAFPVTAIELVLGVGVALMLQRTIRGGQVFRTLMLLPLMTPPIMVGVTWRLIFNPNPTGGLVNTILRDLGLIDRPISILGSRDLAFPAVMLTDIWQWTPFVILLAFAALQTLPEDLHQAAQLDGASGWRAFWGVTFPLLLPSLIAIALIKLIISFKVFDLIYLLTFGGPGDVTTVATFRVWRVALREFNVGLAAAETVMLALVVGLVTLPIVLLRDWAVRRAT